MKYMEQIGMRSKAASRSIGLLGQNRRNEALKQAAKELKKQAAFLLEENQKDIANAREKGMKESLIDRLMLTKERIAGINWVLLLPLLPVYQKAKSMLKIQILKL